MSSVYDALAARKRSWTPVDPVFEPVVQGAEQAIGRATALRCLEIPVGEFVSEASKRDLPVDQAGKDLLFSNIEDEDVHDLALARLSKSLRLTTQDDEAEAQRILSAWKDVDDHPISTARIIEVSIFFVVLTMYRYLGNASTRAVSADISSDERVHVETNYHICQSLGLECPKKSNRLRREVVAWVTEGLDCSANLPEAYKRYGTADFWLRQSDQLLLQGRAPDLKETRRSRVIAFFETNKMIQPTYTKANSSIKRT